MTDYSRQKTSDLKSHLNRVAVPYRSRKSLLSCGIWNESLDKVEVNDSRRSLGKILLSMGFAKDSKIYFEPEEALFLICASLLQVSLSNSNYPLAFDEIYYLWFNRSSFSLSHLYVHQYLTRLGFLVYRHEPSERTENKRKRNDTDTDALHRPSSTKRSELLVPSITISDQIDSTRDDERAWFPCYTNQSATSAAQPERLRFPERFAPIFIDWLPPEFNSKVAQVNLPIYENRTRSFRPQSSLIRPIDLQSHSTIYQRLHSFVRTSTSTETQDEIFFDVYAPEKNFRKAHRGPADFHFKVHDETDPFEIKKLCSEQSDRTLTGVVHRGDISFFSFRLFDPFEALQMK